MAKTKSKWVCQNCGYETVSYLGRCPECSQFGTFVEETISPPIKIESQKLRTSKERFVQKIKLTDVNNIKN